MLTAEDVRNKQIRKTIIGILVVILIVIGCWIAATIGVSKDPNLSHYLKELLRDKSISNYLNGLMRSRQAVLYVALYEFPFCIQ